MTYRIGIIGGDGIGPEVVAEAVKCLDATGVSYEPTTFDLGWERYERDGAVLPDEDLEAVRKLDAVLLGAVGAAAGQGGGIVERGILLRLRFELDLYVNHRPFVAAPDARHPDIDLVVIRENTEGVYAGEGGFLRKGTPHEVATQGSVNTRMGVERCIRYAFELARSRAAQAPHARAQDQRAHVRGRPLAARLRRGGARVPRRRHDVQPRRRCLHLLRAGSGSLRRDRHRQHVRRHHHRPRWRGRRRDRAIRLGQPQSRRAPGRRSSSRSTARRPTSRAPGRPTRAPPSCRPR